MLFSELQDFCEKLNNTEYDFPLKFNCYLKDDEDIDKCVFSIESKDPKLTTDEMSYIIQHSNRFSYYENDFDSDAFAEFLQTATLAMVLREDYQKLNQAAIRKYDDINDFQYINNTVNDDHSFIRKNLVSLVQNTVSWEGLESLIDEGIASEEAHCFATCEFENQNISKINIHIEDTTRTDKEFGIKHEIPIDTGIEGKQYFEQIINEISTALDKFEQAVEQNNKNKHKLKN